LYIKVIKTPKLTVSVENLNAHNVNYRILVLAN